jgi:MOSC domain-containing protein YiiM
VERTGRTGWYLRVLQDGLVGAPADAVLLRRPHPEWTVERANDIMHHRKEDRTAAGELAACPALSASWRDSLGRRAHTGNIAPSDARRHGPDA